MSAAAAEEPPYVANGGYFAVIVSDIDASAAWYRAVFRADEKSRAEEPGRYAIVNLLRDGLAIELIELPAAAARPAARHQGPLKVGALVDDLQAFLAALPATTEKPQVIRDANNGLLLVQLPDPDGNIVQVMQRVRD